MYNTRFDAVKMVRNAVQSWTASDGGLTMAAVDAVSDAHKIQRAFNASDVEALEMWADDDRSVISDAAFEAFAALQ